MGWETLGPILGGFAALITALVKFVPAARMAWEKLRLKVKSTEEEVSAKLELASSLRAMRRTAAVKYVIDQFVQHKGVQRALLLIGNNSGAAWRSNGPLYVSNTAQIPGPGEPNTQNLWQQWKVDAWYVEFLGKLLGTFEKKRGMLLVRDVDVDGELLNQYTAQGTAASIVLPFYWQSGGVLWYVSLNFGRTPGTGEEPNDRQYVKNAHAIYDNPSEIRALIDSLASAYNSVR